MRVLLRFQICFYDLAYFVDVHINLLYLQSLLLNSWSLFIIIPEEYNSVFLNKYNYEQNIYMDIWSCFWMMRNLRNIRLAYRSSTD